MSAFTKTMRFVGDLDDEFYDDERQRDVWNEASAIGFQLFVWTSLIVACLLPLLFGVAGSWIALGLLAVYLTIASTVLAYAKARGIDMYASQSLMRVRVLLPCGIYLIAAFSTMITLASEYLDGVGSAPFVGMALGALIGGLGGVYAVMRRRRLVREQEARDDEAELNELVKEQS
ncbi:hypothetical protein [Rhodococcus sp. B10]|uniref:hypothetical protein n=1 Tax=Rhodococcus sp. B10 TaxID=2695876 RepID=UPI001430946D|nr:hypothetical protein [Rhodococcus sp. B10]NIL76372.1 hypothetical protein [Rhodococcus sp. B10]